MADLATTNRVGLAKVRETTFGITPTNPTFKAIRQTSSGLNAAPKTVASEEIRSDRQVTDLILVGQEAGGDVGGELAFSVADDDFEEALQGTWSNLPHIEVATSDTEISDVSATTLTVASGGASFKTGHITLTEDFGTSANNKLARVSSSSATTIVYPSSTFTAESNPIPVGASVRVVGFEGASGDLAAVTAGGNGLTSSALNFTTLGLAVGMWLKIGGGSVSGTFFSGTAANNNYVRISAIAANKITFDRVPSGWTADAGTSKTIRVFMPDVLVNGSTKRSNTIERTYNDHSPVTYEYFTGMTLNTLNIELPQNAIAKYTKSYTGKAGSVTTTRASGASDEAAPTYDVFNTSTDVGRIGVDGSVVTGPNFVMSATININNNLRRQEAVGSVGAIGIGNGEFTVTGSLNTYFGDSTVYDQVLANTATSYDTRLENSTGNREALVVDLPRIKFSSGAPSVQGKNNDVMIDCNFQAIRDATLGYTMALNRFWYTPA